MKNNQKGFGAVESLLILVIIGIIAGTGWYVMNANKKVDKTNSETSKSSESTSATMSGGTKLTTILTSHNKKLSISIPDGWIVTNDTELDYAYAIGLTNMTYATGKPATVLNDFGHRGGGPNTASFVIQYANTSDLENYYSASEDLGTTKTSSGVVGKKYLYTAKNESDGMVTGTKSYGFKFTNGDKTAVITYLKLPSDPDQLKIVEDSIKTFKFL